MRNGEDDALEAIVKEVEAMREGRRVIDKLRKYFISGDDGEGILQRHKANALREKCHDTAVPGERCDVGCRENTERFFFFLKWRRSRDRERTKKLRSEAPSLPLVEMEVLRRTAAPNGVGVDAFHPKIISRFFTKCE